ncbi:uncharacterized protein RJT21DRAFT_121927 [Scheffersomyces amazonensis]|uniref:uncharacterized protein n=1 Tax=Scheffersomyces amazonensis TaxID=1078765 RepID=UPI00315C500F
MLHQPTAYSTYKYNRLLSTTTLSLAKTSSTPYKFRVYKPPLSTKTVRVVSQVIDDEEFDTENNNGYSKQFEFVSHDNINNNINSSSITTITWPVLNQSLSQDKFQPGDKLTELGRNLIKFLNELGLTNSTLVSLGNIDADNDTSITKTSKVYYCDLRFEVKYKSQPFTIHLNLNYVSKYAAKQLPPNLFITNEQLVDYLKSKIILRSKSSSTLQFEYKLKLLLRLQSIKCHINDLELDL